MELNNVLWHSSCDRKDSWRVAAASRGSYSKGSVYFLTSIGWGSPVSHSTKLMSGRNHLRANVVKAIITCMASSNTRGPWHVTEGTCHDGNVERITDGQVLSVSYRCLTIWCSWIKAVLLSSVWVKSHCHNSRVCSQNLTELSRYQKMKKSRYQLGNKHNRSTRH